MTELSSAHLDTWYELFNDKAESICHLGDLLRGSASFLLSLVVCVGS